jgi:DsbC/DsbD-like thiol-disulfide interchange protein
MNFLTASRLRFAMKVCFSWRLLFTTFLVAFSALFTSAFAQNSSKSIVSGGASSVVTTPQVRAELLAYAPDRVGKGKQVCVGLQITHRPEWHTYWKNSGDFGQPTDMQCR